MILWYAVLTIAVALIAAVLAFTVFLRGRQPNDFTILPTALVALLLIVQVVITIVAPLTGNPAKGDMLEIWMYLIVMVALPIGAGLWALIDRTKWANLVLTVTHLSVAVMTWRLVVLWF